MEFYAIWSDQLENFHQILFSCLFIFIGVESVGMIHLLTVKVRSEQKAGFSG